MQKSNAPAKFTVPFATSGAKNTIPVTSSPTPGLASYTVGFPSTTMEPIASGGIPPAGQDFNGIYYDVTKASLWKQAGYIYAFDGAYASNAAIGGYPAQSLLIRADGKGFWLSTADDNTTDPDATGSAGWLAVRANAGVKTIALSGATTTPDPSALGAPLLVLTGTLTANAALVLPLTAGANWLIANTTTGAFNVTIQGATGAGVQIPQGSAVQCYTDGTAFFATTADVSGMYLPINGNAVSASKLANARSFNLTGPVTWTTQTFDGSANVTFNSAIADGALSIAKTSGLQTALNGKANLSGAAFTGSISTTRVTVSAAGEAGLELLSASGGRNIRVIQSSGGNVGIYDAGTSTYLVVFTPTNNATFNASVSAASLAATGAITSATVTASGTIMAGGFQIG